MSSTDVFSSLLSHELTPKRKMKTSLEGETLVQWLTQQEGLIPFCVEFV